MATRFTTQEAAEYRARLIANNTGRAAYTFPNPDGTFTAQATRPRRAGVTFTRIAAPRRATRRAARPLFRTEERSPAPVPRLDALSEHARWIADRWESVTYMPSRYHAVQALTEWSQNMMREARVYADAIPLPGYEQAKRDYVKRARHYARAARYITADMPK